MLNFHSKVFCGTILQFLVHYLSLKDLMVLVSKHFWFSVEMGRSGYVKEQMSHTLYLMNLT